MCSFTVIVFEIVKKNYIFQFYPGCRKRLKYALSPKYSRRELYCCQFITSDKVTIRVKAFTISHEQQQCLKNLRTRKLLCSVVGSIFRDHSFSESVQSNSSQCLFENKNKIRKIAISSIFPGFKGDGTQWSHSHGIQFFSKNRQNKKIAKIKI